MGQQRCPQQVGVRNGIAIGEEWQGCSWDGSCCANRYFNPHITSVGCYSTFSFVFPAITVTQWLIPHWLWEDKQAAVHGCGQSQGFMGWICCIPITWPGGNFLQMLSSTWARKRLFKCCFLICAWGARIMSQLEHLVWKPRLVIVQTAFGKAVKAEKARRRQLKEEP